MLTARAWTLLSVLWLIGAAVLCSSRLLPVRADDLPEEVDTALVISVDVSNSVDEHRYKLQMDGIAAALEDKEVIEAIVNGPQGGILISMITWADRPRVAIPWIKIRSP